MNWLSVTYGGLTKTITDTSGAEKPNAQEVFFGTFNGVSDSVATPASGEVIIEGDCTGFGIGTYGYSSKYEYTCNCVKKILEFGQVTDIPNNAFMESTLSGAIGLTGELILPSQIKSIGDNAFYNCIGLTSVSISENLIRVGGLAFGVCMKLKTVTMHGATPPELVISVFANGENAGKEHFGNFGDPIYSPETMYVEKIIVPKGCGNVYKAATGWSVYADYIVEAT